MIVDPLRHGSQIQLQLSAAKPTNRPQPKVIIAIAIIKLKVGVNPSLKKEMWLLMHLITKKTCTKMYKIYISGIRKTR